MLDDHTLAEVAEKAVRAAGVGEGLERVIAEPTTDSGGEDAIDLTLVLSPDAMERLVDRGSLDLLFEIHRSLLSRGEERLPIVWYVTEADLAADASERQSERAGHEDVHPQP